MAVVAQSPRTAAAAVAVAAGEEEGMKGTDLAKEDNEGEEDTTEISPSGTPPAGPWLSRQRPPSPPWPTRTART